MLQTDKNQYRGRFAPSPSGPLHFGSLITAVASYLDARNNKGLWFVRMEDIDPPREEPGAQQKILQSLEAHGLLWDGDVFYQSSRLQDYESILEKLEDYTYPCHCSRTRLSELQGIYDGFCLNHQSSELPFSTRIRTDILKKDQLKAAEEFIDIFQGPQYQPLQSTCGDFILKRKDGLAAYQLAVVVDDIEQQITHVIRGYDLLDSTVRQRYLFKLLSAPSPHYGHIPVATNAEGQKLSKQHKAQPLDDSTAFSNLCEALSFLKHPAPEGIVNTKSIDTLLHWAIKNWERKRIPQDTGFVVEGY